MHCTWFNEKKFISPIYIFCGSFSTSNTSPHLLSPLSPLTCLSQRHLGKERPSPPTRPAAPREAFPPRPSWPAASDLAGAGVPLPRLSWREGARAAGQGVPYAPLSALTLFSQPN